jgi:hypothetical protein
MNMIFDNTYVACAKIKLGIENTSGNSDSFLTHLPWQKERFSFY